MTAAFCNIKLCRSRRLSNGKVWTADGGQKRISMGPGVSAKADEKQRVNAKKPVSMCFINDCVFDIAEPFHEHGIQFRAAAFPAEPSIGGSLRGSHRSPRHVYQGAFRVRKIHARARDLFLTSGAALRTPG